MLEEVEDDAFGGEEGTERAADANEGEGACVAVAAFDDVEVKAGDRFDAEAFVVDAADHFDEGEAAGYADFFLEDGAYADGVFGDQEAAGDVIVVKIFLFSQLDDLADSFEFRKIR
jgi:hypothetical protein